MDMDTAGLLNVRERPRAVCSGCMDALIKTTVILSWGGGLCNHGVMYYVERAEQVSYGDQHDLNFVR